MYPVKNCEHACDTVGGEQLPAVQYIGTVYYYPVKNCEHACDTAGGEQLPAVYRYLWRRQRGSEYRRKSATI
jgi:hypothetical protein